MLLFIYGISRAQHIAHMASNPVLKEDQYPAVVSIPALLRTNTFTDPSGNRLKERNNYSDVVDSSSHYFRMIEREKRIGGFRNFENRQERNCPNGSNPRQFNK